jgi:hypothetical protein
MSLMAALDDQTLSLAVELIREFYMLHGRWPTWREVKALLLRPS